MHNNSQGRRDRIEPKATAVNEEPTVQPESRGLRREINPVDDAIPAEVKETFCSGVVSNCLRLNVRKEPTPDAEVLTILNLLSNVVVDVAASTKEFYKVRTDTGIEGFCMKKYIALPR